MWDGTILPEPQPLCTTGDIVYTYAGESHKPLWRSVLQVYKLWPRPIRDQPCIIIEYRAADNVYVVDFNLTGVSPASATNSRYEAFEAGLVYNPGRLRAEQHAAHAERERTRRQCQYDAIAQSPDYHEPRTAADAFNKVLQDRREELLNGPTTEDHIQREIKKAAEGDGPPPYDPNCPGGQRLGRGHFAVGKIFAADARAKDQQPCSAETTARQQYDNAHRKQDINIPPVNARDKWTAYILWWLEQPLPQHCPGSPQSLEQLRAEHPALYQSLATLATIRTVQGTHLIEPLCVGTHVRACCCHRWGQHATFGISSRGFEGCTRPTPNVYTKVLDQMQHHGHRHKTDFNTCDTKIASWNELFLHAMQHCDKTSRSPT